MTEYATLQALREAAVGCRACGLWERGTQTVFGEGPEDARLFLVGEQPGDQEDLAGHPFVGPAGTLLDRALAEAGIDRLGVYLTNVVKHFAWTPKGKRRIHRTPRPVEVAACRPWLDAELRLVDPDVVVCLGAVAAKALLGPSFRVTVDRGTAIPWEGRQVVATVHPSSIIRVPDPGKRQEQMAAFVADLKAAAALLPARSGRRAAAGP
jgi:uracil-DNA glycosylase family protein